MPVDDEAAQIARGLTKAQREALMLLPASGRPTCAVHVPAKRLLGKLRDLADGTGRTGLPGTYAYGLTPFGSRVRAALEAMEKNDAG
jgi:hypothetical protein